MRTCANRNHPYNCNGREHKALGARVIATTHREDKLPLIAEADEAVIDDGKLTGMLKGATKALDLVGPRNLRDIR